MARTIQRFNRTYTEFDPAGDGKIPTWVLMPGSATGMIPRANLPGPAVYALQAPAVRTGMAVAVFHDAAATAATTAADATAADATGAADDATSAPTDGSATAADATAADATGAAELASAAAPDPECWLPPLGLALNDATDGQTVSVRSSGLISLASWLDVTGTELLTPGARYFLSDTTPGLLTEGCQASPGSLAVQVGVAVSEMELEIEVRVLAEV